MNSRIMRLLIVCGMISSLLLSACSGSEMAIVVAEPGYDGISIRASGCDYGGILREIEAVDEYTVRFTLCKSDPNFLAKVAFPAFAILDQDYLATHLGTSAAMDQDPSGTGPYKLAEWVRGERLVLEANPDYWGVPPRSETIVFRWNPQVVRRQADIQLGTADGIDRPSFKDVQAISNDPDIHAYPRASLNTFYIGMNNAIPPFNSEKVRQAFAMAVDREAIVNSQFQTGSEVAEQFLPSTIDPGFTPGYRWYDLNLKEAGDLLDEALFDFEQIIPLYYSEAKMDYITDPQLAASLIQSQLAEIGIHIVPTPMTSGEFNSALSAGELGFFLHGWEAQYPDPADFYNTHFGEDVKMFGRPYSDIVFMMKEAAVTTDPRDREYRLNRLNEMIKLHAVAIPVAHATTTVLFSSSVQNVLVGPLNENFPELSTISDRLEFVQASEPTHLWPGDEIRFDTLRIAQLLYDPLLRYEYGGTGVEPCLAEYWETNTEMTEWTFTLRYGIQFTNGSKLDANDVVATYAAMWDAANPYHQGSTNSFQYFEQLFGGFLNAPES